MTGAWTAAWGGALGEREVTNDELTATLDTSDEWISERTGIRSRWIGGSTTELAIAAGKQALADWRGDPDDIELVLLATSTPDQAMPASASRVQQQLGLRAGAFDLNAACAGFVYGLVTATGLVTQGSGPVLLIGADAMSRLVDWDDRATAVLFGDGAGATVVEPTDGESELLGWDVGSDGDLNHLLCAEHGGKITMDGRELFRKAVRVVVDSVGAACERAGIAPVNVDLFVPHQANERIIAAACNRLGIGDERVVSNVDHTGNTSAGSIPLAIREALDDDRIQSGDHVVVCGFGAGMAWATAVLGWKEHP